MTRGLLLIAGLMLLAGCQKPIDPASWSDKKLRAELERCRGLGLDSQGDATCRAAQRERWDRFMRPSTERAS